MSERLIAYFAQRHLLTNMFFVAVLVGGVFAWQHTNKEELPDVTFDTVRVSARYPGAPAGDVEYFVTRPLEEELRGVDGVHRITSTSSIGQTNITVELEPDYPTKEEAITEIRNAVLDVNLPAEVIDDPSVRVFKTSKKAILDIALIHTGAHLLDVPTRRELQQYAFALETQLISLPQVHSITRRGYLQEEIQIRVYPDRLARYNIPFNTVMQEIKANHVRLPAGTLEAKQEPKITVLSELNLPETLQDFAIQGGFEGQVIRLGEVADIETNYEKTESIYKVNGHEAIIFNVVKTSAAGILEALDAVTAGVERFRQNNLANTPIKLVLLDDESIDVRNRLRLISINGAIGFALILLTLFIFLDARSGIWVAMGIPFTLCFTMIAASLMGYTINGTTLSAVIIVMGIVVDDAIVVAENITRLLHQGMEQTKAIIQGTSYVMLPIIASVVTTCVAFVPLFFFTEHFARIIQFIPPIIFLMLGASLLESIIILPGHMGLRLSWLHKADRSHANPTVGGRRAHWFERIELAYSRFLERVLPFKWAIFAVFILLLLLSGWLVTAKMKFVMFPHEETRDLVLTGKTPPGSTRYETALKVREIEDIITPYVGQEVVGFRTSIARSRRGGAVEDNQFRMLIEIVPKEQRHVSADQLIEAFQRQTEPLEGFHRLKFSKSRWGQASGSPIELIVQQNDDTRRHEITEQLAAALRKHPAISNVDIDEALLVPEFRIRINRDKIKRLSISPQDIASTFRAALEGTVLYEFSNGEEEVRVRLTTVDAAKDDIEHVLDIPVENRQNYLVPLRDIVQVEEVVSPNAIVRRDLKRTSVIDADLHKGTSMTPLDVANDFEINVFPAILSQSPTTTLSFGGEVQETRQSAQQLRNAVVLALLLIFAVLAVLFNSLVKPLVIMLAIPFGVVGIVLAFYLHGKTLFGFYAAVGALGLAGVVINDSIIMLVKLNQEFDRSQPRTQMNRQIAHIASTRLRAVLLTTLTTVVGMLPTAYGWAGYDAMLAEMMLALTWGMIFGTVITLLLIPSVYSAGKDLGWAVHRRNAADD